MKTIFRYLTCVVVLSGVAIEVATAQTSTEYNLTADFSVFQNPNGVWSYEHGNAPITARVSFGSETAGWGYNAAYDGSVMKWTRNPSGAAHDLLAGDVAIHALGAPFGGNTTFVGVAWTSPSDGTVAITGRAWDGAISTLGRNANWTLSVANTVVAQRALIAGTRRTDRLASLEANVLTGRSLSGLAVRRGDRVVFLTQTTGTTLWGSSSW